MVKKHIIFMKVRIIKHLLLLIIISLFSKIVFAQKSYTYSNGNEAKYDVAAYIWPSCHNDPVAQKLLWPEGIGEWQIIKKGTPRFAGQYQPKVPLWGYEMDDDPNQEK